MVPVDVNTTGQIQQTSKHTTRNQQDE